VNEAALLGVRREKEKVGLSELQEAVERVVAGLEKKNRVLSIAEKRRVAHHEVGHALVALALPAPTCCTRSRSSRVAWPPWATPCRSRPKIVS